MLRKEKKSAIKRKLTQTLFLLGAVVLFGSGCIKVDEVDMIYNIDKDFNGSLEYIYYLSSDEETKEERIKEIDEFWNKDLPKIKSDFEKGKTEDGEKIFSCYKNINVKPLSKQEEKCKASLYMEFCLFATSVFNEWENCKIVRNNNIISFTFEGIPKQLKDYEAPVKLVIKYKGGIKENNADSYDEKNKTMIWELKPKTKKSIHFVLEFDKKKDSK